MTGLVKRSFTLTRHRTSIALEPDFWSALEALAAARNQPLLALIVEIDASRTPTRALASALRLAALRA